MLTGRRVGGTEAAALRVVDETADADAGARRAPSRAPRAWRARIAPPTARSSAMYAPVIGLLTSRHAWSERVALRRDGRHRASATSGDKYPAALAGGGGPMISRLTASLALCKPSGFRALTVSLGEPLDRASTRRGSASETCCTARLIASAYDCGSPRVHGASAAKPSCRTTWRGPCGGTRTSDDAQAQVRRAARRPRRAPRASRCGR